MLMEYLVNLLYIIFFIFCLSRFSFFKQTKIPTAVLTVLLVLRILFGWLRMYIDGIMLPPGGDAWVYYHYSHLIYDAFWENPLYFLELCFGPNARSIPPYLAHIIEPLPAWNDVRSFTPLRVNALFRFISFGYYSVHIALGSFLSFAGSVAMFVVFKYFVATKYNKWLLVLTFALPSVLYWTSGLHKEGLSLFCMGFLLYFTYQFVGGLYHLKYILCCIGVFLLLLLVRPYALVLMLPPLLLWALLSSKKLVIPPVLLFTVVFVLGFSAVTAIGYMHPKLDVFALLHYLQHYNLAWKLGESDFAMRVIQPNAWSFLTYSPFAFVNTAFRPFVWQVPTYLQLLASVEITLINLSIIYFIFARFTWVHRKNVAFLLFCVFFTCSYFVLIGTVNDNVGAIVRYRSIVLPFYCLFGLVR